MFPFKMVPPPPKKGEEFSFHENNQVSTLLPSLGLQGRGYKYAA